METRAGLECIIAEPRDHVRTGESLVGMETASSKGTPSLQLPESPFGRGFSIGSMPILVGPGFTISRSREPVLLEGRRAIMETVSWWLMRYPKLPISSGGRVTGQMRTLVGQESIIDRSREIADMAGADPQMGIANSCPCPKDSWKIN